jgi:hypothetical protein
MHGAVIVRQGVSGLIAALNCGGEDILMGEDASQFEVRVGQGTGTVGG